jgi:predicted dehydrogenase
MNRDVTRRELLQSTLGAAAGLALSGTASAQPKKLDSLRVGIVGVGGRGTGHVRNLVKIPGVQLKATCDIVPSKVENAQNIVEKAGQPRPEAYSKGEFDYRRMCARPDLDLIYVATPWEWHVRVAVEAMKNGKHAAIEVPAATTIEECWELVETSESTGRQCVQLENCCYDRVELMALNMVRKNLLGDIVYAECGYVHDLRSILFSDEGEGQWRLNHSLRRNADLYPTHGLGPVAQTLNVNRGNLFDHMVSMASRSASLHEYAVRKFGADSPQAKLDIVQGDVVSSMIHTRAGQTILVVHDTNTPHPYSRKYLLQGTRGILQKYPTPLIYLDAKADEKKGERWEDLFAVYAKDWEHPLWRELEQKAQGSGHGGMDYILTYRLMNTLLRGEAPDMDVYDAAALCAVTELSEKSIAGHSRPMDFPDFTRGRWRSRKPIGIVQA